MEDMTKEQEVLKNLWDRLIAFRDACVKADMICPRWVNDSLDEIERVLYWK